MDYVHDLPLRVESLSVRSKFRRKYLVKRNNDKITRRLALILLSRATIPRELRIRRGRLLAETRARAITPCRNDVYVRVIRIGLYSGIVARIERVSATVAY